MQPAYRVEFAQRDGKRLVGCVVSPTDGDGWRLPDERAWETTFDARPAIRGEIWNWTSTQDGAARVVRGGCWADNAGTQGKSARSSLPPATRSELFGARFVRPFSRCATRP
jgi:formylglycine-generating enzyme required for sulfatase activity